MGDTRASTKRRQLSQDSTPEVVLEAIATSGQRAGGLIRSGTIVGAAVIVANLLNAAFQFVMARLLEPAEYSLLATMFAVIVMITVPITGLQVAMAREVAGRLQTGGLAAAGSAVRQAFRQLRGWMALVVLAFGLSAYPLIVLFHIDRPLPFLATAMAVAVSLPLPLAFGALQGAERFGALSFVEPAYSALKLIAGIAVAALGFGASAVTFGVAGATVASIVVALVPLRAMLRASRDRPDHTLAPARVLGGYSVGAAVGLCAYAVHTSSDIIVARLSFDPTTAGEWAAAATAAKTVLLIPIAVTRVLFPRVAILRDRRREWSHAMAGLLAVAALGVVAATIMTVFGEPLVAVAFGSEYADAARWMGPLSFAMVLYALVQVYLFHFLALGYVRYSFVTAAFLALQLGLFALFHDEPRDLILVQVIAASVLVALGSVVQALLPEEARNRERRAADRGR